jgi:hypothetical protein
MAVGVSAEWAIMGSAPLSLFARSHPRHWCVQPLECAFRVWSWRNIEAALGMAGNTTVTLQVTSAEYQPAAELPQKSAHVAGMQRISPGKAANRMDCVCGALGSADTSCGDAQSGEGGDAAESV